jgi:hypothetical protein
MSTYESLPARSAWGVMISHRNPKLRVRFGVAFQESSMKNPQLV